ncbi:MAG: hypothetical protein GX318_06410, partial [Clostridia bacterium]|nr:hypothetical protein [Clostridia bacterium]
MVIKKTIFRVIAAMVALILLGVGGVLLHQQTKIVPDELLGKALKNTFQAKSYSYKIQSTLYVDGKERPLSDIEGKKDVGDNYHLQG